MKQISITLLLFAFIGSSYGQITSIHLQSIVSGVYTGTVNPADFPTHNFSGETIEINANATSEVRPCILFLNLTQTAQNWTISRRKIGVDASWSDFLYFVETNDPFGGVVIDHATMDIDLWLAPASTETPIGTSGSLDLSPGIFPNSNTGGCGTYRYYLGTAADPFQDSVDVQVCNTLGVDDLNEIEANIYPNPSSSQLNVEADLIDATIAITDLAGRTLMVEPFNNEMNLNVAELKDGVYFVIIEKKGISTIKEKIIVQH
jgi:hypothetical protein